ncbi:cupin domain-containing protein [Pseudoduganella sp. FT26W]|uniref:Cupin domain-containing protein n=1 Tax=Duganella aquatilis TaxID=2666082 RepID=A0A844CZY0_9BURK|nr:cupin domain-containing protein [Duganella aquatilis]MRW85428.1 cupin domain-containing protein [Duganella aquatilis]
MKAWFAATLLAAAAAPAQAHGPAGHEEVIKVLQAQPIPAADGQHAALLTVHYGPGQKSAAHTHPGLVYAYVLEGEVESQLAGEAPVIYRKGQSWYEAPGARHLVSHNASKTRPATLLVVMVKQANAEPVLPLPEDKPQ